MSRRPILLLAVAGLLAACTPGTGADTQPGTVRLAGAEIRGSADAQTVRFTGLRYAVAGRWQPPRLAATPAGVTVDATRPGPVCPQPAATLQPGEHIGEDCLRLTVTVPRRRTGAPRPVLVYLHGGGFTLGSGTQFDSSRLAARGDLVVVTPNYRLGAFGGLALPGMRAVNFGLLDQQAALRWVRANIAAFGGNPRAVTLAGESAGALSTCTHLAAPGSAGLFSRAIIASGACGMSHPPGALDPRLTVTVRSWNPRAAIDTLGRAAARQLGCTDPAAMLGCLRRAPVADLVPLGAQFTTFATGTPSLPVDPARRLRAPGSRTVPVLSGNTADEQLEDVLRTMPRPDLAGYRRALRTSFGADAGRVARAYPPRGDLTRVLGRVYSDRDWICPTVRANREYARTAPAWTYLFADPQAPALSGKPLPRPASTHGSDVAYTFPQRGIRLTPDQRALGDTIIDYWARFARTGDPNQPGRPAWPRTTPAAAPALVLGPRVHPTDLDAAHHCGLWQTVRQ